MRKNYPLLLATVFVLFSNAIYGQSIGIGTSSPNSSAQLDVSSSSRGLLIPRITSAELSSIANPAKGLMVYDTVQNQLLVNMGTPSHPDWENLISISGWSLSGNNSSGTIGTLGVDQPVNFVAQGQPAGTLDGVNTAFGTLAMQYNAGSNNTAIGSNTLNQGTGNYAVAVGNNALASNSGDFNIGIGWFAGYAMTSGRDNIAIGRGSMTDNTTGAYNVGIGSVALGTTTASEYNTVVGFNSAQAYDNGYNNVFVGANNDVTGPGYYNVIAIGQGVICTAPSQARFGNSATNSIGGYADWTNFSDGRYKKNMQENVKGLDFIMRLRPITYNLDVTGIRSHLGQGAAKDEGTRQAIAARETEVLSGFAAQEVEAAATASGYEFSGVDKPKNANDFYGLRYGDFVVPLVKAVQEQQQQIEELKTKVTGGVSATVSGALLAPAATGSWNLAGNAGTSASTNFVGTTDANDLVFRVNNQPSGKIDMNNENTFFGYSAAISNTSSWNTAMGYSAMYKNTTGNSNVAFGAGALLQNTGGNSNSALGYNTMRLNVGGNYNTAVGQNALDGTTNSWYNTVVGANSGMNYDNGYNNVFVGANNDVNGAGYYNVIAIGQAVICTASSQARFGNSATNSIGGYANWTNFSDGRYKKNMKEDVKGLDFIMRLRPITYNLDVAGIQTHLGQKAPADEGSRRSIAVREAEVLSGFSAQEVEAAASASGYDFSGVDKPKNANDFYGLRYGDFVVPLVKAVQEQQKMIEDQRASIAALQKRLDEQDRLIQQLLKNKQ